MKHISILIFNTKVRELDKQNEYLIDLIIENEKNPWFFLKVKLVILVIAIVEMHN
jgi:hypothetical protein